MNMPEVPAKYSLSPLPGDDWEVRFTKGVVQNIARYRDLRGFTTADLAAACNAIYGEADHIKASTLNGLFAGKRKSIGIAEILVFALALNVPPIALLFASDNRQIEVSPGQTGETHAIEGLTWFTGKTIPNSSPNPKDYWDAMTPYDWTQSAVKRANDFQTMNADAIAMDLAERATGLSMGRPTPSDLEDEIRVVAMLRQNLQDRGIHRPRIPAFLSFVDIDPLEIPPLPISAGIPPKTQEYIARKAEVLKASLHDVDERERWFTTAEGIEYLTSTREDWDGSSPDSPK